MAKDKINGALIRVAMVVATALFSAGGAWALGGAERAENTRFRKTHSGTRHECDYLQDAAITRLEDAQGHQRELMSQAIKNQTRLIEKIDERLERIEQKLP